MSEEFNAILGHFKLRKEDCERPVEDNILDEISLKCCGNHWKFLAPLLELEDIVVKDIDCKSVNEKEKRRDFFREWKQRKGFKATYERLILALLKCERRQDAEKVCELLHESLQASLTATPAPVPSATTSTPEPYVYAPIQHSASKAPATTPVPTCSSAPLQTPSVTATESRSSLKGTYGHSFVSALQLSA